MVSLPEMLLSPWQSHQPIMTGGLVAVGYGKSSDLLLVVTHDGRGVIDCLEGSRVARDKTVVYPNEDTHCIEGIGPLAHEKVAVAGIEGGELRRETNDGWRLSGRLTGSSEDIIALHSPTREKRSDEPKSFTGFIPEMRAFGFSPTGRSFVIATGAEVFVCFR